VWFKELVGNISLKMANLKGSKQIKVIIKIRILHALSSKYAYMELGSLVDIVTRL
jgi:hypothetical protein